MRDEKPEGYDNEFWVQALIAKAKEAGITIEKGFSKRRHDHQVGWIVNGHMAGLSDIRVGEFLERGGFRYEPTGTPEISIRARGRRQAYRQNKDGVINWDKIIERLRLLVKDAEAEDLARAKRKVKQDQIDVALPIDDELAKQIRRYITPGQDDHLRVRATFNVPIYSAPEAVEAVEILVRLQRKWGKATKSWGPGDE